MRTRFDKAYYDRFYRNSKTRAATPASAKRQAAFLAAYLRHLEIPVRRILDIGCGLGSTLRALQHEYPRATCVGVEYSTYLCRKYGWEHGSVIDYKNRYPFDLVLCNDVLAYLTNADCAEALANIGRLTRNAAFLGLLTTEDRDVYDPRRTDPEQYWRSATWYRQHLRKWSVNVGGGVYLKTDAAVSVWRMDHF